MSISTDTLETTAQTIAKYVKANVPKYKKPLTVKHHHGPLETVREADYKGHHILIGTTYRVEIDGEPVKGHFLVTDEGQVQYHPLPNYTFTSALDLMKSLIDLFPDDFAGRARRAKRAGHSDGHSRSTRRKQSAGKRGHRGHH